MRQAHSSFIHAAKTKIPQGCYVPGTRGLVSTAGGFYLPVLVISLRMLRRSGSDLPMEVFLASPDEYEPHICDNVLPKLNARCIVLSEILDKAPNAQEIKHYQFKIFALIFSSFEEVVFLDADAFPLYDPELLLTSEPFTKTGYVLWPDYWVSTASPLYYNISAQVAPPVTLRQSSETGELLVSKSQHHFSLMLATYYNYYGPSHYYPLLGQGSPGEGDKDTFIAAASALGEPFYQTSERVKPIGHRKADGGLGGSAMVQFDPMQDYNLTSKGLWRVKDEKVAPMPRPFFIHAHYPKFNPATIFDPSEVDPTRGPNGEFSRAWLLPEDIIDSFGYDVEKSFWEEIKWTACELESSFRTWTGKTRVCERVKFYWESIFEPKS
ncbi:glycosyltransferase family 71 protein [Xylona heveae TC161]|uniref:Glycosyltransferase family 71 protein n=1 Tax=Xylona heveae (strain CBS 132557 / TC161) TaxID=1328760 RepID=A0A165I1N6_XYLHT|nr:glycosyltransferase family 71 protein [Xylona heveae TC161]KZF24231.1 glycosyltransferase family 71 protein [Xylona heveae TC161]